MGELLTAFSGAKRSETDGRTVIDKLYGLKTNEQGVAIGSGALNPTFAGSDRPEFHKTLDGFEQVCVEKEGANIFSNSDPSTEPTENVISTDVSFDQNDWGFKYGAHNLNGKVIFIDNSITRRYGSYIDVVEGQTYTYSFLIKTDDGEPPSFLGSFSNRIAMVRIGGGSVSDFDISFYKNGVWMVKATGIAGSSVTNNHIGKETNLNNVGFEITAIQLEKGSYPTNYIPTEGSPVTRLAASPVIENALPETGGMGFVCDFIADSSTARYLFETTVERFRGQVPGSNTINIQADMFGIDSLVLSRQLTDFVRNRLSIIISWGHINEEFIVYELRSNGEIHKVSDIISDTVENKGELRFGWGFDKSRNTSNKIEKWDFSAVQINDNNVKSAFESITKGTSMETAKEDMVIV